MCTPLMEFAAMSDEEREDNNMRGPRAKRYRVYSFTTHHVDVVDYPSTAPVIPKADHKMYKNHEYSIILGPVEQPDLYESSRHRHGMIQIHSREGITARQALTILTAEGLKLPEEERVPYLRPTLDVRAYLEYCYKEDNAFDNKTHQIRKRSVDEESNASLSVSNDGDFSQNEKVNQIVHDAIVYIINTLRRHPTVGLVKQVINRRKDKYGGPSMSVKYDKVIEQFLKDPSLYAPQRIVEIPSDPIQNKLNFYKTIDIYRKVLLNNIVKNGFMTTHNSYNDASVQDVVNSIVITTLLPTMYSRMRNNADNIPGLYFYGESQCGKSFMFQIPDYYSKVVADSSGVGRYKLTSESAYFLDDVDHDFLEQRTNSTTLKNLLLGHHADVKVYGQTQDVVAWVVATSNDIPSYLYQYAEGLNEKEQDIKNYRDYAYKRRFITVQFTERVLNPEDDDIKVNYDLELEPAIANIILQSYDCIESSSLRILFEPYVQRTEETYGSFVDNDELPLRIDEDTDLNAVHNALFESRPRVNAFELIMPESNTQSTQSSENEHDKTEMVVYNNETMSWSPKRKRDASCDERPSKKKKENENVSIMDIKMDFMNMSIINQFMWLIYSRDDPRRKCITPWEYREFILNDHYPTDICSTYLRYKEMSDDTFFDAWNEYLNMNPLVNELVYGVC